MVFWFCIPCLVLILYFLVASIFFPKYRIYVKEAWKCFLDKLKGKRCQVSFDTKMRIALAEWFAKKGKTKTAAFFYNRKNFNFVLITIFIILTIISIFLFFLLIKFLIHSPCEGNVCEIK